MTLMAFPDNPKLPLKTPATTTPGIDHIKTTKLRIVLMTNHKLSQHQITRNRQAAHAGCLRGFRDEVTFMSVRPFGRDAVAPSRSQQSWSVIPM